MRRPAFGGRIARALSVVACSAAWMLHGTVAVRGQAVPGRGGGTEAGGTEPKLPGSITRAPDWIGDDAPFDVKAFFAPVPRDRDAAPLYLDAFFEFSSEMAVCFPEGPERDRRRQAADDRMKRYMETLEPLRTDPKSVPAETIDAVIRLYEPGFRKLAEAQRRDRCAFGFGVGPDLPLCHTQAARQVARIASLRVRRAVERRDFDAAIREVEAVLRLVRDLRPRGTMIVQLIAAAIVQVTCADMIRTILADPGLRVEHCDRLLKGLLDHEAAGDGYVAGLRGEYLYGRFALRDLVRKPVAGIAPMNPADLDRAVRGLNDFYRTLIGLDGVPFARRLEAVSALEIGKGDAPWVRLLNLLRPSLDAFAQATGRVTATLRATQCMVIMRRWELTHRGLPRALSVAVQSAGLKSVPVDPYDGRPMRVGVFEGQTVVYSVGRDGRDDGGKADSKFDTRPGDLIYKVPEVDPRR